MSYKRPCGELFFMKVVRHRASNKMSVLQLWAFHFIATVHENVKVQLLFGQIVNRNGNRVDESVKKKRSKVEKHVIS